MKTVQNIGNNPLKAKPQAVAKRPELPNHAGKGGLKVAIADAYNHRFLLVAADDALSYLLHQATSNRDFRRLMKPRMVTVLSTK